MILIADIQRAVAAKRHISVRAMKGHSRDPKLVRTRHDAIYLARRLTTHSTTIIGKHFGKRHHTTVIHALRNVQRRIHRNQKTRVALAFLIDELTAEPDGLMFVL
jgi:chromosomal replication initiator protein